MGDRCYYRAEVRREDLVHFMKILVGEAYESPEEFFKIHKYVADSPFVEVEIEEINYGGWTQTEEAAKEGLVFRGYHGSGGDYEACSFVALNKKLYSVVDLDGPVATVHCKVDDEGQATVTINQDDLEKIKAHAEAEWRFQKQYPAIMGE